MDLVALAAWMSSRGLGNGPIENCRRLSGGTQNILLRFMRDGRDFILRRPPIHLRANSSETMRREARLLAAIAKTDVPHPALIALCADEGILGASFYLMESVAGFNPTTGLPPLHAGSSALRHRMGLALVEGIAALGALDYMALGLHDFGKTDNYLGRQVGRWKAQLTSYNEFPGWPGPAELPSVNQIADWLEAKQPASFTPGIIHGDYHLANVLFRFDGPELAAIVDWELTTIGDPLIDLGWLLATWPQLEDQASTVTVTPWEGFPTSQELVDHYARHSSRNLDHINWYGVLACFKLGIILEGTYARACAARAPMDTGHSLHAKTIRLFDRAIRWIS